MFATKMHHTVGHTEIQAFGDIGFCIPIRNTSRFYELGTYQAKHGMISQTRYAFPTELNMKMKVEVLFLRFAFIPPFPAHFDKLLL
jgi:hypothetical protein